MGFYSSNRISFFIKKYYEINLKILSSSQALLSIDPLVFWCSLFNWGNSFNLFIFLFNNNFSKNRNVALVLISVCIFFGKFILVILFSIFYLTFIFQNREIRYFIKDGLIFSIPLFLWLFLVYLFYEKGSVLDYIVNFLTLILQITEVLE